MNRGIAKVIYQRTIEIPAAAHGNVVKLLFGGCNYGAEGWLDDKQVGEHHGPMTPFDVDLTAVAIPGQTHALRVKAWHRFHVSVHCAKKLVKGGCLCEVETETFQRSLYG